MPAEELEQGVRGRVDPVAIIEDEQQRRGGRTVSQALEQQGSKELIPGLRVERGGQLAVGHGKVDDRSEQRRALVRAAVAPRDPLGELCLLLRDGQRGVEFQEAAPDRAPDEVAGGRAMGAAGAGVDREAEPLSHPDDFGAEPGFADPGLTGQADDLSFPAKRSHDQRPDPGDLAIPAHQRLLRRRLSRSASWPVVHRVDRPDVDPPGLALDADGLEPVVDGGVAHLIMGRPVDEELPRLSSLHETRGQVDRVADHRVLAPRVRADLAAVDEAGGDPGAEGAARQREQLQTAMDGSLLVVLVADRRAEVGEQQAALVTGRHLTEVAVVAVDHPHGGGQRALQGGD
jgi:hypothetical protein